MRERRRPLPSILVYHPESAEAEKYASLIRRPRGVRVLVANRTDQARHVISDVDIVYAWKFPTELYQYADRLQWVQAMGAGIDWALADPLPPHVALTRVPGIFGPWMSEYVLAWCLWVTQRIGTYLEAKSTRRWLDTVLPDRLRGKTILLIGVGDTGQAVAKSTGMLGARVIGVSTTGKRIRAIDHMYRVDQLRLALQTADFVVLLVPLTPATRGLISRRELAAMKRSAWLINIARGAVTDELALVQALKQRQIAGAILDVFTTEPLPADHVFWTLENCIVTPHIAGPSTPEEIAPVFNDNLRRFISRQPLRHRADVTKGY